MRTLSFSLLVNTWMHSQRKTNINLRSALIAGFAAIGVAALPTAHAQWAVTMIDTAGSGIYNSIARNPATDLPSIAYLDNSGDVKYAAFNGSTWTISTIATADSTHKAVGISMAFNPITNLPSIGYTYLDNSITQADPLNPVANSVVKYSAFDGSNWVTSSVASVYSGIDSPVSLAFAPNGSQPSIAFSSHNAIQYGSFTGTNWLISNVTTTSPSQYYASYYNPDLVINPSTLQPEIVYRDRYTTYPSIFAPSTYDLNVSIFSSGSWSQSTIESYSTSTSDNNSFWKPDINIDPLTLQPSVVYGDTYATFNGSNWIKTKPGLQDMTALAFNPLTGLVGVVGSGVRGSLYDTETYSFFNGSTWTSDTEFSLKNSSHYDETNYYYLNDSSFAYNKQGVPGIAYSTSTGLLYATLGTNAAAPEPNSGMLGCIGIVASGLLAHLRRRRS